MSRYGNHIKFFVTGIKALSMAPIEAYIISNLTALNTSTKVFYIMT
jgi:hypothetical protein